MILLVNSCPYPLRVGILSVLIFVYFLIQRLHLEIEMQWMKQFFEEFFKKVSIKNLKLLQAHLKRVVAMNISLNTKVLQFDDMSKLQKWQHFLRRRFQETENSYYPVIDELVKKLNDLEIHTRTGALGMPNFDIQPFSFIRDWECGDKSSRQVYSILKTMNMQDVATTSLTRRLDNYLSNNRTGVIADYVLPVRAIIMEKSVPLYHNYLNMLVRYFAKLSEADMAQEKVTWIEQVYKSDDKIEKSITDMTMNQVIRKLDYQVIQFNNHKYCVGENLLCLDENMSVDKHAVHWIFAPKSYVEELKKQFKITDVMDVAQEVEYIKNIMGTYINE